MAIYLATSTASRSRLVTIMDDTFEKPTAGAPPQAERENAPEDDEQGSDDEEGAQDWAKLA